MVKSLTSLLAILACVSMPIAGLAERAMAATARPPERWAVMATGDLRASGFADLVSVKLAQNPGVTTVERTKLDEITAE